MTQTKAEAALAAYDALYKVPNEDRYIIDGEEAQVAADLAAVVREQQEALQQAVQRYDAYEQGLQDRPVIDAAVAAVQGTPSDEDIADRHLEDLGARLAAGVVIPDAAGPAIRGTLLAAIEEARS